MYKTQLSKGFFLWKNWFKIQNILKIFFAACKIHIHTFYIRFERELPIFYTFTIARKTNVMSAALFKTLGNETAHIFSPKQIYASYKSTSFFLQTTAAHEKSPTLNHVVCVTHMLTGYESRAWSTHNMRSRQRIIFIRYFPIFGAIFENIKNRLLFIIFLRSNILHIYCIKCKTCPAKLT